MICVRVRVWAMKYLNGWIAQSLGLDYMRAAASVHGVEFIMIVKSFELFSFVWGFHWV